MKIFIIINGRGSVRLIKVVVLRRFTAQTTTFNNERFIKEMTLFHDFFFDVKKFLVFFLDFLKRHHRFFLNTKMALFKEKKNANIPLIIIFPMNTLFNILIELPVSLIFKLFLCRDL